MIVGYSFENWICGVNGVNLILTSIPPAYQKSLSGLTHGVNEGLSIEVQHIKYFYYEYKNDKC